jgi:hypothetical protein
MAQSRSPSIIINQHDFRFDKQTRRMVCHKCRKIMNETGSLCVVDKPDPEPVEEDKYSWLFGE